MKLTLEALKEFEKLYQQDYPNEKLTKEELLDIATRTLQAIELIFKPVPKDKERGFKKYQIKHYDE